MALLVASYALWFLLQSKYSTSPAGGRVDLSVNLGRVLAGTHALGNASWRNDGPQALVVERTFVSCPCIGIELGASTVEPGVELPIAVSMTTPESWAIERRSEERHSCTVLFKQGLALMIEVRATVLARPVVSPAGTQAMVVGDGDQSFFLSTEVLAPSWITTAPSVVATRGSTIEIGAPHRYEHGDSYPVSCIGELPASTGEAQFVVDFRFAEYPQLLSWSIHVSRESSLSVSPPLLVVSAKATQAGPLSVYVASDDEPVLSAEPADACVLTLSRVSESRYAVVLASLNEGAQRLSVQIRAHGGERTIPVYVLDHGP